jgi:hypothetical protein
MVDMYFVHNIHQGADNIVVFVLLEGKAGAGVDGFICQKDVVVDPAWRPLSGLLCVVCPQHHQQPAECANCCSMGQRHVHASATAPDSPKAHACTTAPNPPKAHAGTIAPDPRKAHVGGHYSSNSPRHTQMGNTTPPQVLGGAQWTRHIRT